MKDPGYSLEDVMEVLEILQRRKEEEKTMQSKSATAQGNYDVAAKIMADANALGQDMTSDLRAMPTPGFIQLFLKPRSFLTATGWITFNAPGGKIVNLAFPGNSLIFPSNFFPYIWVRKQPNQKDLRRDVDTVGWTKLRLNDIKEQPPSSFRSDVYWLVSAYAQGFINTSLRQREYRLDLGTGQPVIIEKIMTADGEWIDPLHVRDLTPKTEDPYEKALQDDWTDDVMTTLDRLTTRMVPYIP